MLNSKHVQVNNGSIEFYLRINKNDTLNSGISLDDNTEEHLDSFLGTIDFCNN